MSNAMYFSDLVNTVFDSPLPDPILPPPEEKIPWEEWVRNNLGDFLDIAPYNPPDAFNDYMTELVANVGMALYTNEEQITHFVNTFFEDVSTFFPQNKDIKASAIGNFIEARKSQFEPVYIFLGLVYAYHQRRKLGKQEDPFEPWIKTIRKVPPPPPTTSSPGTHGTTNQYQEFVHYVRMFMSGASRWSEQERSNVLQRMQSEWSALDPYAQKDLQPLLLFVQQHNKTI